MPDVDIAALRKSAEWAFERGVSVSVMPITLINLIGELDRLRRVADLAAGDEQRKGSES